MPRVFFISLASAQADRSLKERPCSHRCYRQSQVCSRSAETLPDADGAQYVARYTADYGRLYRAAAEFSVPIGPGVFSITDGSVVTTN